MRKQLMVDIKPAKLSSAQNWLDVENIARVELSSEEADHPIEHALRLEGSLGWRASVPGKQTIRILFDRPQEIHLIKLSFDEPRIERTQEYVLRWASEGEQAFREIVRQQWNFNPNGATSQTEEHQVNLPGLTALELCITPDISGSDAHATLAKLRIC